MGQATCIGYTRVSTADQSRSGLGRDDQRARITAEAERHGWEVVWIEDTASGRSTRRPGLQRALKMLAAGEAEAIIVSALDRLSRSTVDFGKMLERAQREGWAVVACDVGLDMSTSTGRMVSNIVMSIAQWERERIGERTTAAMQQAKRRGVKLGGPRSVDEATRRKIMRLARSGKSLAQIATVLNDASVPTGRGAPEWSRSAVHWIVRSEGGSLARSHPVRGGVREPSPPRRRQGSKAGADKFPDARFDVGHTIQHNGQRLRVGGIAKASDGSYVYMARPPRSRRQVFIAEGEIGHRPR